ncbi:SCO3242 family prenyltransferase [Streptomyces sp. NPDC048305]|uniref:SCO3242 family prenyltransferase n=1 Tax=Streptomyces sp. NPDC048305 TaxID=3365532 RepID=UPI00371052A1
MTASPRQAGAPTTHAPAPSAGLSGAGGTAPAPDRPLARARAWAELLRVSALFTVPGDALAGAAARGGKPGRGTLLAVGASLCLYEAGMALNDWADREEDAVDRPHRPIPSGRVAPGAALAAAGALTAAGLALAARAGRPALAVASGLAATVWAYDLRLKHTGLGPAAMAAARALDVLLGATATGPAPAKAQGHNAPVTTGSTALPAALVLGAHTYAVTAVSRHEAQGGSTTAPLAALAGVTALSAAVLRRGPSQETGGHHPSAASRLLLPALTGGYLRTAGVPLLHAALNPSPPLTQRAVGAGIRAMIPLQAALAGRSGAPLSALAVSGLVPLARALARKVSPT